MASFSNATTDGQHGVSHVVDAQVAVLQKLPHVSVDSDAVIVAHELGQGLPVRGARFTDDGGILCEICDMVLNGPTQWSDHKKGRHHKHNCQRKCRGQMPKYHRDQMPQPDESKVAIPPGTALIVEQSGIADDALRRWEPKHRL